MREEYSQDVAKMAASLGEVTPDLWHLVFERLDHESVLCSGVVCKDWNRFCNAESLWEDLYKASPCA